MIGSRIDEGSRAKEAFPRPCGKTQLPISFLQRVRQFFGRRSSNREVILAGMVMPFTFSSEYQNVASREKFMSS